MATKAKDAPKYVPTPVEPPPMRRGAGRNSLPMEFITGCIELLNAGQSVSDGLLYDGDGDREKAKQRANTAAMKLRKAIVHTSGVDDPKVYRQRVWEDPENPGSFRIAVVPAPPASNGDSD